MGFWFMDTGCRAITPINLGLGGRCSRLIGLMMLLVLSSGPEAWASAYTVSTSVEADGIGYRYSYELRYEDTVEPPDSVLTDSVWQWGFPVLPGNIALQDVRVPEGWTWRLDAVRGRLAFYTEGASGWAVGDFGPRVIPPGGRLAGFSLWSRFPARDSLAEAFDTIGHREWALVRAPGPQIVTIQLKLLGAARYYSGEPFRVKIRRQGETNALEQLDLVPGADRIRLMRNEAGPLDVLVAGGSWLAKTVHLASSDDDAVELGPIELTNGDVNQDNTVNIADFLRFRQAFGSTPENSNWVATADLNLDGSVNILDFLTLRRSFGQSGDV